MPTLVDTYEFFSKMSPRGDHTRHATLSSPVTLSAPDEIANAIMISAETQNVRIRLDGGTATATVGFVLLADSWIMLQVENDVTLSVIEVTASAVIQYQWVEI